MTPREKALASLGEAALAYLDAIGSYFGAWGKPVVERVEAGRVLREASEAMRERAIEVKAL